VTAVVGSGIAAQTLSPGDTGLALLENAIATGGALFALILLLGPVSGAHFNPVVTLADVLLRGRPWRDLVAYVPAQVVGGILGALLANAMFDVPQAFAEQTRGGGPVLLGEVVATFGLVLLIAGLVGSGTAAASRVAVPAAVAAYIVGAYWFTSSTSFANPAVTVGRIFSDTFAGIAPSSAPAFIAAQIVGSLLAIGAALLWWPRPPTRTLGPPAPAAATDPELTRSATATIEGAAR
jgi:glycerol uptake facilitator-like aquaporin